MFPFELDQAIYRILEVNGIVVPRRERRQARRYALRQPVTVTPVDDRSGRAVTAEAFDALLTDISSGGFGLVVDRLITTEKAVLTFWHEERPWCHLLFEPRWIKFTAPACYQVGGRLVMVLPDDFCTPPGPPRWHGT